MRAAYDTASLLLCLDVRRREEVEAAVSLRAGQPVELEIQYANVIPMLFFGVLLVIWIGGGGILGDVIYGIVRFLLGV